ncbi:MAG: flippase-like domain-containing protein [Blastocatellia bacterium]|nr:flippase-like domain-containing protein [Blastocatellia bacterium]
MKIFKHRWIWKGLLMLVLLFLILRKIEFQQLSRAFEHADWRYIAGGIVLSVVMVWLRIYKWQALLQPAAKSIGTPRISFFQAAKSMLGGMAFGLITPARAGEFGRIWFLPTEVRTVATGLFFVDRAVDLVTVLMTALIGSAKFLSFQMKLAVSGILLLTVIGVLAWPVIVPWTLTWFPFPKKLQVQLEEMAKGLTALRYRDLGWNLTLGMGLMVLDVWCLYWMIFTFEPVTLEAATFAFPLILLSTLIPVTLGGVGVREGTAVYVLKYFHVSELAAFNSAFLLYLFNSLIPGLWGILYVREIGGSRMVAPAPTESEDAG